MEKLFDLAQKNAAPLNATVQLYGRASQAADNLQASEADLMKLTDAVGLSLKVSGESAESASGGLRQLGQLLSGNKVQAEEYNSLLDSLNPLLQAVAAGSDRWGGSVAKLTADVKKSDVTTHEFFQAALRGYPLLQQKADAAAATMAGAFQKIENALTKYIGETDSSLGVTQRLVDGLNALADNFEKTADQALQLAAIVAGALVGRSIGGMVTMLPIAIISIRLLGVAAAASAGAASFLARNFAGATTAIAGAAAASRAFRYAALGILAGPIGMVIGGAVTVLAMFTDEMIRSEGQAKSLETTLARLDQVNQDLKKAFGSAADALKREREELENNAIAAVENADKKVAALKKVAEAGQLYGEEGMYQQAEKTNVAHAEHDARNTRHAVAEKGLVLPDPTDDRSWKPTVTKAKPGDEDGGGGGRAKRDDFKEARDALIFEGEQLNRNSRERAIANELQRAGKDITAAQAVEIRNLAAANYDLELAQNSLNEAVRGFGDLTYEAFSSLIKQGQSAEEVLDNLLDRLVDMVLQSALLGQGPLSGLMGTQASTPGGTGGLIGAAFSSLAPGGGKAAGGRVFPRTIYPVGERGRELFAPDVPGHIIPHDQVERAEKLETTVSRRVADGEIDLAPLRDRLRPFAGKRASADPGPETAGRNVPNNQAKRAERLQTTIKRQVTDSERYHSTSPVQIEPSAASPIDRLMAQALRAEQSSRERLAPIERASRSRRGEGSPDPIERLIQGAASTAAGRQSGPMTVMMQRESMQRLAPLDRMLPGLRNPGRASVSAPDVLGQNIPSERSVEGLAGLERSRDPMDRLMAQALRTQSSAAERLAPIDRWVTQAQQAGGKRFARFEQMLPFGGMRAAGGPAEPGTAYVVGERGREYFSPDVPGQILTERQVEREAIERLLPFAPPAAGRDPTDRLMGTRSVERFAPFDRVTRGRSDPMTRLIERSTIMQRATTERLAPLDRLIPVGGMRASGGPVKAGMPYIVGEQGKELFVPKTAGDIVPNDKLSRSIPNMSVPNFNFPTIPPIVMPAANVEPKFEVTVNNQMPNAQVQTQQTRGANGGRGLQVTVSEMMAQEVRRPGSALHKAVLSLGGKNPTKQTG